MQTKKRRKRLSKKRKLVVVLVVLLIIFISTLVFFNSYVNPIIITISEASVKTMATKAVNGAVQTVINNTDLYDELIDILVDGKFVEEKKNLKLKFRGSENQRLIDMNKTRTQHKIALLDI